jgi:hypothetical protein
MSNCTFRFVCTVIQNSSFSKRMDLKKTGKEFTKQRKGLLWMGVFFIYGTWLFNLVVLNLFYEAVHVYVPQVSSKTLALRCSCSHFRACYTQVYPQSLNQTEIILKYGSRNGHVGFTHFSLTWGMCLIPVICVGCICETYHHIETAQHGELRDG